MSRSEVKVKYLQKARSVAFTTYLFLISSLFQEEMAIPDPPLVPKKETAWERGLKLAKEVRIS